MSLCLGLQVWPGRAVPVPNALDRALEPPKSGTGDNKLKYGSAQPRRQADQPAQNGAAASTELPFRISVRRRSKPPSKEIRNEYIRRFVCLQSVVCVPRSGAGRGRDGSAMAPAHDLVVRSLSTGAAL